MKFIYLLLSVLLLGGGSVSAQTYDRSSVSLVLLNYNDPLTPDIQRRFSGFNWGSRYDKNELSTKALSWDGLRTSPVSSPKNDMLCQLLNQKNIGREVLAYIYNRQENGSMNAELINQRAAYNKTDRDYNIIQATAKKGSGMQDGGEKLIGNSYIVVYDYANIQYLQEQPDKDGREGDFVWKGKPAVYLFRLQWTDELRTRFYEECWIDEETAEDQKDSLRQHFNQFEVPVEFVMRFETDLHYNTGIREFREKSKKEQKGQTEAGLKAAAFTKFVDAGLQGLTSGLEQQYDAFHVKSAVYDVKPIRAKIGRKEGVKTDHRFFMYEYVLDNEAEKRVRKGVIRATNKVSDNRKVSDGETTPTEFYQIAGRAAQSGWELEEKKSLGINLQAGYQVGNLNGITAGISGSLYGRRNLNHYLLLDFTYGLDSYSVKWNDAKNNETTQYNIMSVNLGYGYGLMKRNWELYPYAGFGIHLLGESTKNDDKGDDVVSIERPLPQKAGKQEEDDFSEKMAWMFNAGVRGAVNIYYPVQLFGAVEYSTSVNKGKTYEALCSHKDIDKATSGIHYRLGVRVCF